MRILLLDHDHTDLTQTCHILHEIGYQFSAVTTYEEAFRDLHDDGADVLIVEWDMPDKDIREICSTIRELQEVLGFVYIIVLTKRENMYQELMKRRILDAFEYGINDIITKPICEHVIKAKLKSAEKIIHLHKELRKQNLALHKLSAELSLSNRKNEELAITDELTKTYNRRYMIQRFKELLAVAIRNEQPLSCLMLDVDNFKGYNDSYGHDIGDKVLQYLATTIKENSRTGNIVSRFGGEEFVIVCPHTTLDQAKEYAERLRKLISDKPLMLDKELLLFVTVSIGVSTKEKQTTEYETMIQKADKNMYRAKERGKNRVC